MDRVYLDLKTKKIVGIKPKPRFGEILAQAAKNATSATAVLLGQDELQQFPNVGMVETGESRTPRPEVAIDRMYYKLIRWFYPRPLEAPPTEPLWGQPVFLRPPLLAWGGPHPGFMAPDLSDSRNTREQTKPL